VRGYFPATTNLTPSWVANLLRPVYRESLDLWLLFMSAADFKACWRVICLSNEPAISAIESENFIPMNGDFPAGWRASAGAGRVAEEAIRARPEAWMAIKAIGAGLKCGSVLLGTKNGVCCGFRPDIVEAIRQTVAISFGAWKPINRSGMPPKFATDSYHWT